MFNNHSIDSQGEELQIQIRFADTQEQKSLKQATASARQFRSAEYEFATQAWRQGRLPYAGSTVHESSSQNPNEFDQYIGTAPSVPIQGQRWAQSAIRQVGRSPLGGLPYTGASTSQASGVKEDQSTSGEVDTKPATSPATAQAVDSAAGSEHE